MKKSIAYISLLLVMILAVNAGELVISPGDDYLNDVATAAAHQWQTFKSNENVDIIGVKIWINSFSSPGTIKLYTSTESGPGTEVRSVNVNSALGGWNIYYFDTPYQLISNELYWVEFYGGYQIGTNTYYEPITDTYPDGGCYYTMSFETCEGNSVYYPSVDSSDTVMSIVTAPHTILESYSDNFNSCVNWYGDGGGYGPVCNNSRMYRSQYANEFLNRTTGFSIEKYPVKPVYVSYDIYVGTESLLFDSTAICDNDNLDWCINLELYTTYLHITDYSATDVQCPYNFTTLTTYNIKKEYLTNGTLNIYVNDILECSAENTIIHDFIWNTFWKSTNPWDGYIENFYIGYEPYVVPSEEPIPEPQQIRRGGNNAAYIVQQNLVKQTEATNPKPANLFDALVQVIHNIRRALGLEG